MIYVKNVTKPEEVLKDYKVKQLTKDQILISLDRLTRFKFTEEKYLRVFKDIVLSNLINPRFKRQELDEMDYAELAGLAEYVINSSLGVDCSGGGEFFINKELKLYENYLFNLNKDVQKLLDNKINYAAAIEMIDENAPLNLKWLKSLAAGEDARQMRRLHSLRYPLEKVVICEGITEEILLPEFARILGYDFHQNGVYVISAGGKNQVVKAFYRFSEILKLPIFVLLDKDAASNSEEIQPKLRDIDRIYLLKSGEFEDILPITLVEKTLNYATRNISLPLPEHIESGHTVEFLEDFFKNRGMHEFKKAEFAEMVKENLTDCLEVSDEIRNVIDAVRAL